MAKRKSTRGSAPKQKVDGRKHHTMDSGVSVWFRPFPLNFYTKMRTQAEERFPDETPPTIEIETVDGTETVEDLDNAEYLEKQMEVEKSRRAYIANTTAEFALEMLIDIEDYEELWLDKIEQLKRYIDFPEDEEGIRMCFLENFAISSERDYEAVVTIPISLSMIDPTEVEARVASFQNNVAGATVSEPQTPSTDGKE